jgi:hypothetical protein
VVDVGEHDHELAAGVGRGQLESRVGDGVSAGGRCRRGLVHGGGTERKLHE